MKSRAFLKYFILLTLICGGITSCKKYLDKKPDNSLATAETLSDLQALLDNDIVMNNRKTSVLPETSADNYYILPTTFTAQTSVNQHQYLWQYDRYDNQNDWLTCYQPVYYANLCLEVLETISRTSTNASQWDQVKGSALFFRSYYFQDLLWAYSKAYDKNTASSDLGISLKQTTDFNAPTIRNSVQQCYDQIINDTKESSHYLQDIPLHPLRPSKAAAYGLLARTYLSMRMYDSAFKYSDLSLQIKSDLINYNMTPCTTCDVQTAFTGSAFPFRKYNAETIFYTEMVLGPFVSSTSRAIIDTFLYAAYNVNDLRKAAYFFQSGGYRFKGSYAQSNTLFTGITTAEILLTRAECRARGWQGMPADKDAAMGDLNTLLIKCYPDSLFVPDSAATAPDALNKILLERRKELVFRGLRWMDIKRLNKEGANITLTRSMNGLSYSLAPNDDRFALPIPQQIIDLTGIPQNPGWP